MFTTAAITALVATFGDLRQHPVGQAAASGALGQFLAKLQTELATDAGKSVEGRLASSTNFIVHLAAANAPKDLFAKESVGGDKMSVEDLDSMTEYTNSIQMLFDCLPVCRHVVKSMVCWNLGRPSLGSVPRVTSA